MGQVFTLQTIYSTPPTYNCGYVVFDVTKGAQPVNSWAQIFSSNDGGTTYTVVASSPFKFTSGITKVSIPVTTS
jgi:hypothetical protein